MKKKTKAKKFTTTKRLFIYKHEGEFYVAKNEKELMANADEGAQVFEAFPKKIGKVSKRII